MLYDNNDLIVLKHGIFFQQVGKAPKDRLCRRASNFFCLTSGKN